MSAETVPVPGNEVLPAGSVAVAVTVSPSTRLPGFGTDPQGNVDVADADVTVTVDTVPADLIGAITIPEDLNGDG
ncbi:hypothetical protein, partial [Acinetobacter baumannii]